MSSSSQRCSSAPASRGRSRLSSRAQRGTWVGGGSGYLVFHAETRRSRIGNSASSASPRETTPHFLDLQGGEGVAPHKTSSSRRPVSLRHSVPDHIGELRGQEELLRCFLPVGIGDRREHIVDGHAAFLCESAGGSGHEG